MSTTDATDRPLTILVTAFNAVGHMNAVAGATRALMERGHRMVFLVEKAFSEQFHPLGFEEHIYSSKEEKSQQQQQQRSGEWLAEFLFEHKIIGPFSVEEKMVNLIEFFRGPEHLAEWTRYNEAVKEALELYKPDLVYYDYGALVPAIYYSGVPWIKNYSVAPTFTCFTEGVPPGGSGYSLTSDRSTWEAFKSVSKDMYSSRIWQEAYIEGLGFKPYPGDLMYPETQLLTVYACPQEVNYPQIAAKEGWFNLEVFHRDAKDGQVQLTQLIPEAFMLDTLEDRFTGKYIYLSLGSMASVDLELMRRLLSVLATTNHKYIVSKGPRGSELILPSPNMWGEDYLPQTKLLHHVHLVITHAGNNSFTECLAAGKPMVCLPCFGDQFDSAQRIHELKLGKRINPYNFADDELTGAIEELLYDNVLNDKLRAISERIQNDNRHEKLADKIEHLARNNKL
ncbi:hypothetical protein TYRP_001237 [Tyrophagus putrescentiae]|nr:hypothetical protein TYRP_001237 [Tyrophagus putrescentiae]